MTRRHLRNIERTDARRAWKVTSHMVADVIDWGRAVTAATERIRGAWEQRFVAAGKLAADAKPIDRRDYVWPDAVETPTSGTETGQDGDEGVGLALGEGSYYSEVLNTFSSIAWSSPRHSGKTLAMSREVERMIAEAVAHEREAIARWLEANLVKSPHVGDRDYSVTYSRDALIQIIRAGAHNYGGES